MPTSATFMLAQNICLGSSSRSIFVFASYFLATTAVRNASGNKPHEVHPDEQWIMATQSFNHRALGCHLSSVLCIL